MAGITVLQIFLMIIRNQGLKLIVRVFWIDQSQYKNVSCYTQTRIVIGQFKQCELTISNPGSHWLPRFQEHFPTKLADSKLVVIVTYLRTIAFESKTAAQMLLRAISRGKRFW